MRLCVVVAAASVVVVVVVVVAVAAVVVVAVVVVGFARAARAFGARSARKGGHPFDHFNLICV